MNIKLSKDSGPTRRINFTNTPSWLDLSAKVSELYAIPQVQVAVGYTDPADGDIVTISSDDELTEFFASTKPGELVRLIVQDLGRFRSEGSILSTPSQAGYPSGNAFAAPVGEYEWEDLAHPPLMGNYPSDFALPINPREAFIEVLTAEMGSPIDHGGLSTNGGSAYGVQLDKGKGRATSQNDDDTSTRSILDAETPKKPPINLVEIDTEPSSSLYEGYQTNPSLYSHNQNPITEPVRDDVRTPVMVANEATPLASTKSLYGDRPLPQSGSEFDKETQGDRDTEDPPLPTVPSTASTPSLAEDVATLLSSLSAAASSHPELPNHLRNLMNNVAQGVYWSPMASDVQRAASQAASEAVGAARSIYEEGMRAAAAARENEAGMREEIRQAHEAAQAEAGVRVAEALSSVLRAFSGMGVSTSGQEQNGANAAAAEEEEEPRQSTTPPYPPPFARSFGLWGAGPWGRGPYGPPYMFQHGPRGFGPPPIPHMPPGPPGPPPMHHAPPPPPPPHRRGHGHEHGHGPPGPHGHGGPLRHDHHGPPSDMARDINSPFWPAPFGDHHRRGHGSRRGHGPGGRGAHHGPEGARARVDSARAAYKREKENYRRLKRGEETTDLESGPEVERIAPEQQAEEEVTVVSKGFPEMDMISIPAFNAGPHGSQHGSRSGRRHKHRSEDAEAVEQIEQRLSDMGFNARNYPDIQTRIKAKWSASKQDKGTETDPFRTREDDIVTSVLEELLSAAAGPSGTRPAGSVSGNSVPGAWD